MQNLLPVRIFRYAAFIIVISAATGCKTKIVDDTLSKQIVKLTNNQAFKSVSDSTYKTFFENYLHQHQKSFNNPQFILNYYQKHNYQPVLILKYFNANQISDLINIINKADEHALSPSMFGVKNLQSALTAFQSAGVKDSGQVLYTRIAALETAIARSYIRYANVTRFGLISPARIYRNYQIATPRPTDSTMAAVLNSASVKNYLDSVAPTGKTYKALQQLWINHRPLPGMSSAESRRVIKLNMERYRWRNMPTASKYVWVNIPDYRLNIMNNGRPELTMAVCVGESGLDGKIPSLAAYDSSGIRRDTVAPKRTPQIKSRIYAAQVNPIWNIPQSIASKEIVKYAAADRYYLSNKNIDVYQNGKKVANPDGIDWSAPGIAQQYSFKQRPGEGNALGKIKFLFENGSSIYLHDTPSKRYFALPQRAVSHGCIRVEDPKALAGALWGEESKKFKYISKELDNATVGANDVTLKPQTTVFISYHTLWLDQNNQFQHRPDIYGLDAVLYSYLQRYFPTK